MTVFDLEKEELGDWFPFFNSTVDPGSGEIVYDDPEEGAAEFRIRSMGSFWEERRKGKKKEYKMVCNTQSKAMERVGYYPDLPPDVESKENDDAWDYSITDWKNAFSAPKMPMEYNRENKLKMIKIPVFMRFVSRVFQIMTESGIKRKDSVEKNS